MQNYLTTLQSVINRMATNSSSCKTLCITLVSALFVVITNKDKTNYAWIALLPVIVLSFLDAYYLGLEQGFRATYNSFVKRMHAGQAVPEELFLVSPRRMVRRKPGDLPPLLHTEPFKSGAATAKAFISFSIYPFYLTLVVIVILSRFLIF